MAEVNQSIPAFIPKVVDFSNGKTYELLKPLTDYRKCHDGTPLEARIVFTCRESGSIDQGDEHVMKIKVQTPQNHSVDAEQGPVEGPSTTTAHELEALQIFTEAGNNSVPHLITWKRTIQGSNGPMPGGYITYMVMTKMPGQNLLDGGFWKTTPEKRQEVIQEFVTALRSIYSLGIEPVDCALRNVLWDEETKRCTIIDFELWREATDTFGDEVKELERWGLAKRKPPMSWWAEWNVQGR